MRLKSIELAGFKSFVDPTRIEFGGGITAIIGPNGCGKSNIVDAIRWVLGEHSAKQLRGGVMEDLIFQGSETRPMANLCEVELTFTAEKGSLPPPYQELEEISIRRRMSREFGSEVFINGRHVRLKDVVNLFLDTGVSSHAYAIIEQGAISRIIQAKPEERRTILEEAAGVMRYRTRRREAQKKMEATLQNLERLRDLHAEMKSRCRSLKQQAARAERFKRLQEEMEEIKKLCIGLRLKRLHEQCEALKSLVAEAEKAERHTQQEVAELEKSSAALREEQIDIEIAIDDCQTQLREAERRLMAIRNEASHRQAERKILREKIAHLDERVAETTERLHDIREKITALQARLSNMNGGALQEEVNHAERAFLAAKADINQARAAREKALQAMHSARAEAEASLRRKRLAQASLQRLQARREDLQRLIQETLKKIQALAEKEASLAREEAELKRAFDACSKQQLDAKARLDHARTERLKTIEKAHAVEKQVFRMKGEVEALQQRIQNPEVGESIRKGLALAGLQWLDEQLDIPEGLESVIASVFHDRKPAYSPSDLGDDNAWQALTQAAEGSWVLCKPMRRASVEGNLAEALGFGPEHPLFLLFSAIALRESLKEALQAVSDPACAMAATQSGWLVDRNGWIYSPGRRRTAELLALRRKLRKAQTKLALMEKELKAFQQATTQAEAALLEAQHAWDEAVHQATLTKGRLQEKAAALRRCAHDLQALRQRLTHLESESAAIEEEYDRLQAQIAEKEDGAPETLAELQSKFEDTERRVQEAESAMERMRQAFHEAERKLVRFQQERQAYLQEKQRLEREQLELSRRRKEHEHKRLALSDQLRVLENDEGMDKRMLQADRDVITLQRRLQELREKNHTLAGCLHTMEAELRQKKKRLEEQSHKRQEMQLRLAAEQAHFDEACQKAEALWQHPWEHVLASVPESGEHDLTAVEERARLLDEQIHRFGPVNLLAIEEFEEASARESFLQGQIDDLEQSIETLKQTIQRIDHTSRTRFRSAFEQANALFKQTFPRLFGGGRAELRLLGDDELEAGIEIIAQPPGKKLQDIGLLSGGEKALTAVALVFAIFQMKPAPFCILDEVDAPLDDANVGRFGELLRDLAGDVQFLAITHNKITMQLADRIIGVSMPEAGVSRIVGVELESGT